MEAIRRTRRSHTPDTPCTGGVQVLEPHREPKHTDPNKVGYQVFLGPKQYFVSSDVGNGEQQYYAFLEVPAGGDDEFAKCEKWENYREMLIDRFQGWAPAVMERLECTRPEDVERRDVNDIIPDPRWVDGRMALLGDSAHAVQPNLGQGGGQAIEARTSWRTNYPSARAARAYKRLSWSTPRDASCERAPFTAYPDSPR